jgi:hypothetical protein
MTHRTIKEQIEQLKEEIRQEKDPFVKEIMGRALLHFYKGLLDGDDGNNDGQKTTLDIFISHSSRDAEVAEALIVLLRSALSIPAKKIRCTSVEGYMLDAGVSVNDQLRIEIHEAKSFIGLITRDSLDSTYVLFELGARWGAGRHLIPVLLSASDKGLLQDPLKSLNALCCDSEKQLHQLIENMASALNIDFGGVAAYQDDLKTLVRKSKARKRAAARAALKVSPRP